MVRSMRVSWPCSLVRPGPDWGHRTRSITFPIPDPQGPSMPISESLPHRCVGLGWRDVRAYAMPPLKGDATSRPCASMLYPTAARRFALVTVGGRCVLVSERL